MSADPGLVQRIREALAQRSDVVEKRMFGGVAFMVRGHMCCGVANDDLMLRVGAERYPEALTRPHAREMDFTKKPLKGFVYVAPAGIETDNALESWLAWALEFVESLPPK
ncbi:MAG: TfoX/Sxy family protein [Gemmatimonadota bacterium]